MYIQGLVESMILQLKTLPAKHLAMLLFKNNPPDALIEYENWNKTALTTHCIIQSLKLLLVF